MSETKLVPIHTLIGKYFPMLDAQTDLKEYGAIHRALAECRENTQQVQREVDAGVCEDKAKGSDKILAEVKAKYGEMGGQHYLEICATILREAAVEIQGKK